MKKSALKKDILRDIKGSLGRFLSIASIVALGVAFFAGLKISPEDMRYTADKYYDDYNLMDIRVVSTLGLTEDDVLEIKEIEGVQEVLGTYTIDALAELKEKEIVFRIHSFVSKEQINGVNLIEGRLPKKPEECVVELGKEDDLDIALGSKIKLSSGKEDPLSDSLLNTEFTVVGKVQTPYYLSFEKGNSTIGNGQVRNFIMIPQENFKLEAFTDIYAIVEGAKDLNSYDDEYFHVVDKVTNKIKNISKERENIRSEEVLNKAKEKLEEGKNQYFEEKAKVEEELVKGLNEIEAGKRNIAKGEEALRRNEADFNWAILEGKEKLGKSERQLSKGEEEYESALKSFNKNKKIAEEQFKEAEKEIKKAEEAIPLLKYKIEQLKIALENPFLHIEEKESLKAELQQTISKLRETQKSIESGNKELAKNKIELAKGEEKLKNNKEFLVSSREKLEKEKLNLINKEKKGLEEIKRARKKLEKAKIDLEKGEEEYKSSKEKANKELAKAWGKIEDGERELNQIQRAKWYILDRKSHYSYMDYGGAADRIDALSTVFPVFFALVAALVSLTTMTRMVDEQRVNIGTLKALGYGKGAIASKYIFYALTATVFGCIVGIGIGYTLFPTVIFNAYGIMYVLPSVILRINIPLAISISLVSIGLTTITAYLASNNELKENPASLMRPRAPKLGKRILLEKIPIIWSRLNFSYKVTLRNIFRYKRRFFMTVFGIAGCTALVLTAFGIRDSIRTVVDKQYGELFAYNVTIGLDSDGIKHLDNIDKIKDYQVINRESGSVSLGDIEKDISIIVPKDLVNIDKLIKLQNRKDGTKIKFPNNGIVISEQIGKDLKVKVGDKINLINSEEEKAIVEIVGITENYTFNYGYLSSEYYKEIFQRPVKFNEALGILEDTNKEIENQLSKELISKEGINSVSFNTTLKENFEDTIESLNYVVLVMIVSAGSLAFVVLYNLTNVNISERIREIATIKVLGFYDNEVSAYIYRENIILTIIGTLVGLVMGIFLHRYIMITVEMENIMFGLKVNFKSYIYSMILTIVFSVLVNLAMHYKLKNVEMVESLKSVD